MFSLPFYLILSLSLCLLISMLLPLLISVLNSAIIFDYFCTPLVTSFSASFYDSFCSPLVTSFSACSDHFIICLIFREYCLCSFVNSISEPFCDPVFLSLLLSIIVFMYEIIDMLSLGESTPIDWHHPWLWRNQSPLRRNHPSHGGNHPAHWRNQSPHWRNQSPRLGNQPPHWRNQSPLLGNQPPHWRNQPPLEWNRPPKMGTDPDNVRGDSVSTCWLPTQGATHSSEVRRSGMPLSGRGRTKVR